MKLPSAKLGGSIAFLQREGREMSFLKIPVGIKDKERGNGGQGVHGGNTER